MNNMLFLSFIVTCPDPPPSLDNGDYTLSSSNIVGSIATYRCNEGYRFNTTATSHTCQPNEMWSMEDIQCEKGWKIILLVCSVAIPSNQDSEILTPQYTGQFLLPKCHFVYNSIPGFRHFSSSLKCP